MMQRVMGESTLFFFLRHNPQLGNGANQRVDNRIGHGEHRFIVIAVWIAKLGVDSLFPPA